MPFSCECDQEGRIGKEGIVVTQLGTRLRRTRRVFLAFDQLPNQIDANLFLDAKLVFHVQSEFTLNGRQATIEIRRRRKNEIIFGIGQRCFTRALTHLEEDEEKRISRG